MSEREVARRLLAGQPDAQAIRIVGRCPACKGARLLSYTLPVMQPHPDPERECCGHFCLGCGFSGATSRDILSLHQH